MLERLSRTRRNFVLLVLGGAAVWFFWTVRGVLNPLLCGYLLAYILVPLVERLERRGLSRRTAVNLIFVTGLALATLLLIGLAGQLRALTLDVLASAKGPPAAEPSQGTSLHEMLQERADEFTTTLNGWGLKIEPFEVPDVDAARAQIQKYLDEHGGEAGRTGIDWFGRVLAFLGRFLGGVFSVLALFFLVPLYTYYFLFVIQDVHAAVQRYFPRRERERLTRLFERIGEVISSFFRGRLVVALIKGLFLAIGLTLAGMPYGFLIGILSGALSIIPFIGSFTGFVLTFAVGIIAHGVIGSAWRAGLVFGGAELFEGYLLLPKILGDRLGLHPLVVFFALLAGGAAMGMFGLLVALPLTATLVILFQEFVSPALKQFADETN